MNPPRRRVLMLYPAFPGTYWGLQYVLPLMGKKAYMPPLGLITIAAMLPPEFEVRLRDLNCEPVSDDDIAWADVCFLSAMITQKQGLIALARRCLQAGKPVVMGGPFPTMSPDECAPWCTTIVAGEAEAVWDRFLDDLIHDRLQARYSSDEKPDVTLTPVPRFDLLNISHYLSMPVQFSRGCPFRCEFCDIIVMFGRRPRTKTPLQMVRELEALKHAGYRGEIFVVDDNFIGNKKDVRQLLPVLQKWNDDNARMFEFGTEASVDLGEHEDLMEQMVRCGFRWVFLGIETPSKEGLKEALKFQNLKEPLTTTVDKIRATGLQVSAGFIIGFDSDTADVFDRQLEFIAEAGIPLAMVGLLIALNGTPLYDRMKATGRLLEPAPDMDIDHCGYTNIQTALPRRALLEGYRRVMLTLYSPDSYFERSFQTLVRSARPTSWLTGTIEVWLGIRRNLQRLMAAQQGNRARRLLSALGAFGRMLKSLPTDFRRSYLRFTLRVLRRRPDLLGGTLELMMYGYHFNRFTVERVLPQLDAELARLEAATDQQHLAAAG